MTVKLSAWNQGADETLLYLRLRADDNGTLSLEVCDDEGNPVSGGVLMKIGPKGFYLVEQVTAMPLIALDGRNRLMQVQAATDVW
jgi:hypothetical protein